MRNLRWRCCASLAILALTCGLVGCEREPLGDRVAVSTKGSPSNTTAQPDRRFRLAALPQPPGHRFEFTGLSDRERAVFAQLDPAEQAEVLDVRVVSNLLDTPRLLGTASIEGDALCFTPRFPLEPDVSYRMEVDRNRLPGNRGNSADLACALFQIERESSAPTTKVERIYPTSDQLPENQLKFYIHFSAPMSRGEAYRHVHLIDAQGQEVEGAFLELGQELWDGDLKRFTLLFDPGRVKRGLKPREELGPVLREGHRYTLVVDDNWRDAARTPLASGARKEFSVGPPDEKPIDPADWKVESPRAGGVDPLVVRFGEPLDQALLERVVWVAAKADRKVAGTITTSDRESCWQFTPQQPWSEGTYQLVAETMIEDLAGNSIGRPFEVDKFGPISRRIESKTVSISFSVEP